MDSELIVVLAILAVIWMAILLLRVPAFVAFFALLVGQVLSTELKLNISGFEYSQAVLLVLPLLLTMVFLRGRAPKSKLMLEFIPAFCVALCTLVLLYPLVEPLRVSMDIVTEDKIVDYRSWILAVSSVIVLASALFNFPKGHEGKHHK